MPEGDRFSVSFTYPNDQKKVGTDEETKAAMLFQQKIDSKVFFTTAELFAIFGKATFTAGSGIFGPKIGYQWWIHLKKGKKASRIKQMLEAGLKPLQSTFGTFEIKVS